MKFSTLQFLLKYSLAKPSAFPAYLNGLKNQKLSKEELEDLNWNKTKKLLHHAYETVPFYYQKYSRVGLHPNDIQSERDYQQVPILTKEDLSTNYNSFISQSFELKSIKDITTGGSTGVPLRVGRNKSIVREAQKWRIQSWWGINPTDNMATAYRPLPYSKFQKAVMKFIYLPQRLVSLDATKISEESIERFIKGIKRIKPKMIHGYVGAIDAVANYILDNKIDVPRPKTVWLTASPITSIQEKKIGSAFNSQVCDQYGCSEVYFISAECPHKKGLHILSDMKKVEFVDKNDEGFGKLIITDLEDYAFPLIRYMNGDEGRFLNTNCSCGMNLPLMDKVKGRISDNLELAGGIVISGEYLTTIFDDYVNSISSFQVIQKSPSEINMKIVPKEGQNIKQIAEQVSLTLKNKSQGKATITFDIVSEIPDFGGKMKFIVKDF